MVTEGADAQKANSYQHIFDSLRVVATALLLKQ